MAIAKHRLLIFSHFGSHQHKEVLILTGSEHRLYKKPLCAKHFVVVQYVFALVVEISNIVTILENEREKIVPVNIMVIDSRVEKTVSPSQ